MVHTGVNQVRKPDTSLHVDTWIYQVWELEHPNTYTRNSLVTPGLPGMSASCVCHYLKTPGSTGYESRNTRYRVYWRRHPGLSGMRDRTLDIESRHEDTLVYLVWETEHSISSLVMKTPWSVWYESRNTRRSCVMSRKHSVLLKVSFFSYPLCKLNCKT